MQRHPESLSLWQDRSWNLKSFPNLIPYDGVLKYLGVILDTSTQEKYFKHCRESLPWERDEIVIFGKKILTSRMVVWFSDSKRPYIYSNTCKLPNPWTPEILELRQMIETITEQRFNSCLANLYLSGEDGMSWHSDDESSLVRHGMIASFSLGAERRFDFRHKNTRERFSLILESGSLLLMSGEIQAHWLHALPKSKKVKSPRVNLTFRQML